MKTCRVKIRLMLSNDTMELVKLEKSIFTKSWNQKDFKTVLSDASYEEFVAEVDNQIVGYLVISKRHKKRVVELERFAVHTDYRRMGIAKKFIERLISISKTNIGNVTLRVYVPERNLEAQLFLKSQKFLCVDIVKICDEDEYKFELSVD